MQFISRLFKEKFSQSYAILLIFLIPVLIIANGLWQISVYQKNMNLELKQKSQLVTKVFSDSLGAITNDINLLQNRINQVKNDNPEIDDIIIISPTKSDFPIVAATDSTNLGVTLTDSEFVKVWANNQTISRSFTDKNSQPPKKFWLVATTVNNSSNLKQSILILKIDTSKTDTLSRAAINQSLVLLVFTVFVVFLLLINYFRFFEYFINYRKLQEVDKMKDEFISMVSHEIKTPLATVKGYLDMLFQGLTGQFDENTKEHLVKISANVGRLDLLVSELLDVSRLEQDRMQFDMQPVDVTIVVQNVLDEIGDQAKNKGLAIEHNKLTQTPPVFADPDRLHQIFENLIGNAIKYTPKGKIIIHYELDKGQLKTMIKDSGIGMAPLDTKRLFERFYRIKNEKTMNISGTGLGLWITKAISKRMNGNIVVKSQENIGSEFSVILPFIKDKC